MKNCACVLIGLFAVCVHADVTVTNLTVAQRPGTKLMDIAYDVSSATTNQVFVSLTVSNGAAKVSATNLTGAVGSVPVGTNKTIVWNMVTDWNTNAATLSFSVWADDGVVPCPVAKSGQWPYPRFTVMTNGTAVTVLDNLTGLEWVKAPHSLPGNSGSTNWNAAIDFCNNLVYAGQSDWRLPSRKELMSLVDYGRYSPALPAGHPFAGVQNVVYWSGTSYASGTALAWRVDINFGGVSEANKASNYYVWPVRGGQ